jgi:hypothetical protein
LAAVLFAEATLSFNSCSITSDYLYGMSGGAEVPPTYHQLELTITNTAFSSIKKEPLITK